MQEVNVKTLKLVLSKDTIHSDDEMDEMIWIATGYDEIQCEQLRMLVNNKGSVIIKTGDIDEILPMYETMQLEEFKVSIIPNEN